MRHLFFLCALLALALFAASAHAQDIDVQDATVGVGRTAPVHVVAQKLGAVEGYQVQLSYSPEAISIAEQVRAPALAGCLVISHADNTKGIMRVSAVCPTAKVRDGVLFDLVVTGKERSYSVIAAQGQGPSWPGQTVIVRDGEHVPVTLLGGRVNVR